MLTLEEAQARAIALAPHGSIEARAPSDALGLALARPVCAARTQPAADLSAMDGYAIAGDGPWVLQGESRAGAPFDQSLQPGQCARISTGARMPDGADRVLIQENASVDGDVVALANEASAPIASQHVRKRGFDFTQGQEVLGSVGEPVGPGQIALLLAAGVSEVEVHAPARVAILECGDELCADPTRLGPNQIPASNGAMIEALLKKTGCSIMRADPVADDPDSLLRAFDAFADADILLISGGASVGDHDHVHSALAAWGAQLHVHKVAIKPGKPVMAGKRDDLAVLGLPGNPVSSFVTAFLFALPMVRKTMGFADLDHHRSEARMAEALPAVGSRREFLRGRWRDGEVRLAGSQDSSALRSLAEANCLIDRPAGADPVRAGEAVPVYNLQNG